MANKESNFINMVITLFVITLVSAACLGYVYEITKEPIAAAKQAKKTEALKLVLPEFDNEPLEDSWKMAAEEGADSIILYQAKKGDKVVGIAIETYTTKGFSGLVKLMVGLKPDGVINDIVVLEHKETPGLGDKMQKNKSNFSEQLKNKDPQDYNLTVSKDGGDVDAITAATISSRAYCDAVARAYNTYMSVVDGVSSETKN